MVLLWINIEPRPVPDTSLLLRVGLPVGFLLVVTAFWFDSIGRHRASSAIAKLQHKHAREREKIRVRSEQEKLKVMEKAQSEIHRQSRVASGKANLKVGAVFVAATGAGVLMLMANLVTFGLVTMMTAGGAMGGYLLRWRQEQSSQARLAQQPDEALLPNDNQPRIINDVSGQSTE